MAKAQGDSRFGHVKSSKIKFREGEPVVVIRGTDPLASKVMIEYARMAERDGAAKEVADEMFDHAMTIAEWQRHNPEHVKSVSEVEPEEEAPDGDPG